MLEKGHVNGPKPRVAHEESTPEPAPALEQPTSASTSIEMGNSILIQDDDGKLTAFTVSTFSSYSTGYNMFI